jgi:hypothetical protein
LFHYGFSSGPYCAPLRSISDTCWAQLGSILGPFWNSVGAQVGFRVVLVLLLHIWSDMLAFICIWRLSLTFDLTFVSYILSDILISQFIWHFIWQCTSTVVSEMYMIFWMHRSLRAYSRGTTVIRRSLPAYSGGATVIVRWGAWLGFAPSRCVRCLKAQFAPLPRLKGLRGVLCLGFQCL